MSSEGYHEAEGTLSARTKDMHRAIVSLTEELEAIDWYQQRAEAATDDGLRAVLLHNKREEIEHAMMVLEWIRRHDADFDTNIRKYLMTEGPIEAIEAAGPAGARGDGRGSLAIGSLKRG